MKESLAIRNFTQTKLPFTIKLHERKKEKKTQTNKYNNCHHGIAVATNGNTAAAAAMWIQSN